MAVTPTYVPSSFVQQALAGYLAVDGATAVPASAANPLPVTVVSGGSTSQIVVTQYVATAAATGYSVGDIIEHVVELNLTTTPATVVASIWVNATQGTVLASAPSSSNIAQVAGAVTAQPTTLPAFVATSGTAYDLTKYGSVQVQVETLAPGESVAVTGSLAVGGTKHPVANLLSQNTLNPTAVSTITVAGTYSALFGGNKELVLTSSGGSPNTGVIIVSGAQ